MNRLAGIICFLLLVNPLAGQLIQKKGKGDAEYSAALQAFKKENYQVAFEKFAPLTTDYSNQERSVYAHYFYASAAQHLGKDKEGWNMLQQLLSRYPNWGQKDEAYYLAGLLNFKLKNYFRGLDYLHKIGVSSFQNDVAGLKQHYLVRITDLGTLKGLYKQFPDDRILASVLVKTVKSKASVPKSDVELAKSLVSKFKLSEEDLLDKTVAEEKAPTRTPPHRSDKKYFDIAVLLPFRIEAFDAASRSRNNQYVFDYYQGLLLAKKTLSKEKIEVRLHPYDIGNTKNSVSNLTRDETFSNADLIIGPLYQETSEEAAEFSKSSGIPVINPLSTDSKLLTNKYPFYFLAHASLGLQAKQVAQVAKRIDTDVKAMVYFGDSSKDSLLAELYQDAIESAGGEVLEMKKIGGTPEAIANGIAPLSSSVKPTHVVLFSTDPRAGRAFLNQMRGAGYERTPLIATATSFDRYNTDFSIYGRDIYLLDTDYIDYERSETKVFQHEYYQANNTLPSVYSYQGYDHLLFVGRKLSKYKERIGEGLSQTTYSDSQEYFLGGFDFRNSRENSVFSIRKYQGNSWVPAN